MAGPSPIRRGRGARRSINAINMVPFIDVMLVLLIIFMITAPMLAPSLINLPQVGQADERPPEVVQVEITRDEALQLRLANNAVPVLADNLVAAVNSEQRAIVARSGSQTSADPAATQDQLAAAVPVVISADKGVRYEAVIRVMDSLQRAGMQRVGLSVNIDEAAPTTAAPTRVRP